MVHGPSSYNHRFVFLNEFPQISTDPDEARVRLRFRPMDGPAKAGGVPAMLHLRNETLPQHHRDPFDRLLIAQAQHEGLCKESVSSDSHVALYGVPHTLA
jgi:hypothetical protein